MKRELEPCPCCGRRTLAEIRADCICGVCWWHDDGQDNSEADVVRGGPNADLSLTQARVNALQSGIFDPRRADLGTTQAAKEAYAVGRTFVLSDDKSAIMEPATGWKSRAFMA